MNALPATLALPTADRSRAFAFYGAGLGWQTPGELADDGVPEPLRVLVNPGLQLMMIPTGGFAWGLGGRAVADEGTVECRLAIPVDGKAAVDRLLARALAAGAALVSPATEEPWGYSATFADPDGHLVEVVAAHP